MTMVSAHSPLLPQVQSILQNMGYAPVAGDTGLYAKRGLSVAFYLVSAGDVQKMGVLPMAESVPHARFVADHVQYLFR